MPGAISVHVHACSRARLRALPQHEAELPIACVEGWSKSARWTGVRVMDLVEWARAPPHAWVRVVSLRTRGGYRVSERGARARPRPLTLLALRLNGTAILPDPHRGIRG